MVNYEIIDVLGNTSKDYSTREYLTSIKGIKTGNVYDTFEVCSNRYKYIVKIKYTLLWSDSNGFRHKYNIDVMAICKELGIDTSDYFNTDFSYTPYNKDDNLTQYINVFNYT